MEPFGDGLRHARPDNLLYSKTRAGFSLVPIASASFVSRTSDKIPRPPSRGLCRQWGEVFNSSPSPPSPVGTVRRKRGRGGRIAPTSLRPPPWNSAIASQSGRSVSGTLGARLEHTLYNYPAMARRTRSQVSPRLGPAPPTRGQASASINPRHVAPPAWDRLSASVMARQAPMSYPLAANQTPESTADMKPEEVFTGGQLICSADGNDTITATAYRVHGGPGSRDGLTFAQVG